MKASVERNQITNYKIEKKERKKRNLCKWRQKKKTSEEEREMFIGDGLTEQKETL